MTIEENSLSKRDLPEIKN